MNSLSKSFLIVTVYVCNITLNVYAPYFIHVNVHSQYNKYGGPCLHSLIFIVTYDFFFFMSLKRKKKEEKSF